MQLKLTDFGWPKVEIRQFFAPKKGLTYFSLILWAATGASIFLYSAQPHQKLSALDRAIGTGMDNSFVGPAINAWINYAIDSPGVKDKYSIMAGIGPAMIILTLAAASIITLIIWYCLVIADSISVRRACKKAQATAVAS